MTTISCPVCDKSEGIKLVKEEKELTVRNELITVPIEYYKCSNCREEFLIPDEENDPFDAAYRLYRSRHNMLQPEAIRDFRRRYHLTQSELATLLGLGGATISRYENGRLQDETHETLLRLAMEPNNLQRLITNSSGIISSGKKKRILQAIKGEKGTKAEEIERLITLNLQHHEPDEFNGFKRFHRDKFLNAILYFCVDGELKTKLNKLLFYADFWHFKEYTLSLTGTRYAHIPFGPAPDEYHLYYPVLERQGIIKTEEIEYTDFTGEKLISQMKPDLNIFSESELRILASVKEFFKNYSARMISDYSHREKGYQDTATGDIISYLYAQYMG